MSDVAIGAWAETVFSEDLFVMDVVVVHDSFAALLADLSRPNPEQALTDRVGRFQILETGEDGSWEAITDWVQPPMDRFEFVEWTGLAVVDGGYAVSGFGGLVHERGELEGVPVFARVDRETGEHELMVDANRPDGGRLNASLWFGDALIGVGQDGTDTHSWGPGIWTSTDGLVWEPVPAPNEMRQVIFALDGVAASPEMLVAVGRNNDGGEPPWVLSSADGVAWQADLLPMVDVDENVRLFGVVHDGNDFVIVGTVGRGQPSREVRWHSADGVTWQRQGPLPEVFGDDGFSVYGLWGGDGMIVASGDGIHRSSVLYCYDDPDSCRQRFSSYWLRSAGEWNRIIPPTGASLGYTIVTDGERFVTTGWAGEGGAVWTWLPGAGTDELFGDPFDTSPPRTALPVVGADRRIDVGTVYAYPIGTGCHGMEVLGRLNGTWWLQVEGPTSPEPDWPVVTNESVIPRSKTPYGTVELVDPGRIEYAIPGIGAVAAYGPAPPDYEHRACL